MIYLVVALQGVTFQIFFKNKGCISEKVHFDLTFEDPKCDWGWYNSIKLENSNTFWLYHVKNAQFFNAVANQYYKNSNETPCF